MELANKEKQLIQYWRQMDPEQAEIAFYMVEDLAEQERQRHEASRKANTPGLRLVSG